MFFKDRLSIKEEVFYSGLFFSIITLVVFGLLFYNSLSSISIDRAKGSIQEANKQIGTLTEGLFTEITNTIEALARNHNIINAFTGQEEDTGRALAIYQDFFAANQNITYIYSGYENGMLLINDYIPPAGFDSTNRPWYIAAMEKRPEQSIGLPYREANTNEWLISQSKALQDAKGNYTGVIAIDCSLADVIALINKEHRYTSQNSYILDQNGEIIIHPDKTLIGKTIPQVKRGMEGREGELSFTEDNRELWAYYSTIDSTGWIIVTTVDRWEILKPMLVLISLYTLAVVLLATALGTLQGKIIEKRFADPLIALGQRIEAITEGKSRNDTTYHHSNHEIAMIAKNIEQLAEHSLHKKAIELKAIIESTQDGILVVDDKRQVIYVNSRFKEMWRLSQDTAGQLSDRDLIKSIIDQLVDPDTFLAKLEEVYASDRKDLDILSCKDGRVFERFTRPLGEGQVMGRLWSFRDITERRQAEEKLRKMATTDELTGLWNRRYFLQATRQEIDRAQRYDQPLSLIVFDVDNFKKVNDTRGHAAGDATLQHLASLMKKSLRDIDIPGRLGGEEFGILLPNTELNNAALLAERLRKTIEDSPADFKGSEINLTVSIGVTAYQNRFSSVDELLKTADEALYEAKGSGKNCTVKKL